MNIRGTMDTGVAAHVMLHTQFPKREVGVYWRTQETNEGTRRCIKFRSSSVVQPLMSIRKGCASQQRRCAG